MDNVLISAIIIARNEEQNIGRCLKSLTDSVEEIIVIIDNRTTDRTEQIIKEMGVTYEVREWNGYVKTKEYAISKSLNDWILWIDADEALTKELSNEICEIKKNIGLHAAYTIPRKAYFLNKWIKHSGWYPARVTRLFNKKKVAFSDKDVHENLTINGSVGQLENDIEHWTDPCIEHYFKKFNQYTTLAAKEMADSHKVAGVSDLLFRPAFLFFKMYFLKRGFLDGWHGFILAIFSAVYVFTKYCKLKEINTNKWRENGNRNNTKYQ